MTRFHITKKGNPGRCTAEPGNCPLGSEGDHYTNPTEAREAYEASQEASFSEASKASRVEEVQDVIVFIKAEDLKLKDDYEGSPITSKKVGSKWVTLSTEANPKILLPLTETVAVQRTEATPETNAEDLKSYVERRARRMVDSALVGLDEAQAEFNESVAKNGGFTSYHMERLMRAQANRAVAEQLVNLSEREDLSLSDAATKLAENYKERLTTGFGMSSGISRSTNALSNVMEDVRTEAMLNFIRDPWNA